MIVTQVKAVNWRNLRQISVPLERRVFAVGPNAGGKSNFLDIFRFLREIAARGGGLHSAVGKRGGVGSVQCRAGEENGFEIAVTLGDGSRSDLWRYEIGVERCGTGKSYPLLKYERVFRNGKKIVDRPDAEDRRDPVRLEQTYLENVTANEAFRPLASFFSEIAYHSSASSGVGRRPWAEDFSGHFGDEPARNILRDMMAVSHDVRKSRIAKIEEVLQLVVPQFRKLDLTEMNGSRARLETMFDHWRPGEKLQQEQFSEGTLRLIDILWALLSSESVLLLEEPELSLHPSVVRHLPGLIYRLKRKQSGQTILTTHSPELLSDEGIDGREVILFLPDEKGGNSVVPASELREAQALIDAGLNVGEVVLPRSQAPRVGELGFYR